MTAHHQPSLDSKRLLCDMVRRHEQCWLPLFAVDLLSDFRTAYGTTLNFERFDPSYTLVNRVRDMVAEVFDENDVHCDIYAWPTHLDDYEVEHSALVFRGENMPQSEEKLRSLLERVCKALVAKAYDSIGVARLTKLPRWNPELMKQLSNILGRNIYADDQPYIMFDVPNDMHPADAWADFLQELNSELGPQLGMHLQGQFEMFLPLFSISFGVSGSLAARTQLREYPHAQQHALDEDDSVKVLDLMGRCALSALLNAQKQDGNRVAFWETDIQPRRD